MDLKRLYSEYSHVFPVGSAGIRYPSILIKRRKRILSTLDSFALIAGATQLPGQNDLWTSLSPRWHQEPAFSYLTGINQTGLFLLLDPSGKEKEILFLPRENPKKEFWEGIKFGYPNNMGKESSRLRHLKMLTGIRSIKPVSELKPIFLRLLQSRKIPYAYVFYHSYTGKKANKPLAIRNDHNWFFLRKLTKYAKRNLISESPKKTFSLKPFASILFAARLALESFQIADTKLAIKKTRKAFLQIINNLNNFKTEHELRAFLEYQLVSQSVFGLSFTPIVASGKSAKILHYTKNDSPINPGTLVLLDFGVRYGTMHSDISRTIPISGTFNPLQKLLYSIVLDAQNLCQKNLKAGITLKEINSLVWNYIEDQLKKRFLARGGKMERNYKIRPHGVSHLIGEQIHDGDPFRLYQDVPLKEGWLISNEPGLYGYFSITLGGKQYSEHIGIRIEDNILITKTGCINLSKSIPKTVDRIESLISKSVNRIRLAG